MIRTNGHEMIVSRGDTASVTMNFSGDVPEDGTTAVITLKKSTRAQANVWEKRLTVEDGAVVMELENEDTDLEPGTYMWDVRLLMDGGKVYTPIRPAPFTVLEVVGSAE